MIIAVDFDGTCVTHRFPSLGEEIGAVPVLKKLVEKGHDLILWTMRSDIEEVTSTDTSLHLEPGPFLTQAIDWFKSHNIPLYGVQVNPTQHEWTTSRKCYAQLYIDDAALGCPLIYPNSGERPFVDWKEVEKLLIQKQIL